MQERSTACPGPVEAVSNVETTMTQLVQQTTVRAQARRTPPLGVRPSALPSGATRSPTC